jgi:hypothetical protein
MVSVLLDIFDIIEGATASTADSLPESTVIVGRRVCIDRKEAFGPARPYGAAPDVLQTPGLNGSTGARDRAISDLDASGRRAPAHLARILAQTRKKSPAVSAGVF